MCVVRFGRAVRAVRAVRFIRAVRVVRAKSIFRLEFPRFNFFRLNFRCITLIWFSMRKISLSG